jgi:hypothetical protein
MALDCVIIEEVDLGRVCHCLAATLATLAAHAPCAAFIMGAPEDSVVRSVLALLDVEEDGALSNAGGWVGECGWLGVCCGVRGGNHNGLLLWHM